MSELHDLAAAYALDALDGAERAAFEAHLAGCPDCRREVAELGDTAATLAGAAAQAPPPELKRSIMAAISATPQDVAHADGSGAVAGANVVSLAARRRTTRWLGAAAAAVLAIVAIGVVVGTRSSGVDIDDVYAAGDVRIVTLEGDDTSLRVAWSRELDRVVVDGEALADPGAGNVYELWAIVEDVPVPAGLIEHDGGALSTLLDVDDLDVAAWGVTIEPAGGSETPTPPILYYADVE